MFLFQKKIFFAARKTSGDNFDGAITYDIVDINEGAGFDQQTGKFRAPEGGTYFFTFSGLTSNSKSSTYVRVYKDGSLHHVIADENEAAFGNNINGSWMTSLSKGEEVHLQVTAGKLWADSYQPVIFTGNLLKLDEWAHLNGLISKNFDKNTMFGVNTILISNTLEREKIKEIKNNHLKILRIFWNKVKMSKLK